MRELLQAFRFFWTAFIKEYRRSRRLRKIVKLLSGLSTILTFTTLFIGIQFGVGWLFWITLSLLILTLLALPFMAVYRYHMRTAEGLNTDLHNLNTRITELTTKTLPKQTNEIETLEIRAGFLEREKGDLQAQVEEERVQRNNQISALTAERDSYKSELEEIKRYKLIFEVDTNEQSQVMAARLTRYVGFEEFDFWRFTPNLKIRFVSHDPHPSTVLRVRVSLVWRDERVEREIPPDVHRFKVYQLPDMKEFDFNTLKVGGGEATEYFWITFHLEISSEHMETLSRSRHFLRVTMDATRQPPYSEDLYADWGEALKGNTYLSSQKVVLPPTREWL